MRPSATVAWQYREIVRAAMRLMTKGLLKKHKYPPDRQDDAIALVIAGGCFGIAQHMGACGGVGLTASTTSPCEPNHSNS